jgi:hypothetical protein
MIEDRKDKSSETTEIYTHVGNRDLGKIKSPLDNLELRGDVKKRTGDNTKFVYKELSEIFEGTFKIKSNLFYLKKHIEIKKNDQ